MSQAAALPDVVRDIERTATDVVAQAAAYPSSILADVAGRRGLRHDVGGGALDVPDDVGQCGGLTHGNLLVERGEREGSGRVTRCARPTP